jgi:hypothetical protein
MRREVSRRNGTVSEREEPHMARKDPSTTNDGSIPAPPKENGAQKSWAGEHGGLVFLMIVLSGILLLVLYEVLMH